MESELIQTSKQQRPQKPSATHKQFKDSELENHKDTNYKNNSNIY